MQIRSDSFERGQPIPSEFALGAPEGFGGNRNPHLAWDGAPDGTRSFVLMCIDADAPTRPDMAGKEGVEIPSDQPRADFVHWVMVDIAPSTRAIDAGACSHGFDKGGKPQPQGPAGARQGRNDYTGWFAGDADMAGTYRGYDGPYPPPNDLRVHRYFFRVFALDVDRLEVGDDFTAADAFAAMHGHVLAEASIHGTYSLNRNAGA